MVYLSPCKVRYREPEYKYSNKIDDNSPKRESSHEYILELYMVTDSDFIEPNINEYEIQE